MASGRNARAYLRWLATLAVALVLLGLNLIRDRG
jgi:hypothetical protein